MLSDEADRHENMTCVVRKTGPPEYLTLKLFAPIVQLIDEKLHDVIIADTNVHHSHHSADSLAHQNGEHQLRYFLSLMRTPYSSRQLVLRIPDTYEAKIAKICNFWTF